MRAVWILVAVAVVAIGAWFIIGRQEGEPVASQPMENEAPANEATTENVEETAVEAVEEAVEQVQETVNEAVEDAEVAVETAIEEVVEEAGEAVDNAAAKINEAVSDVLGNGDDPVETAVTGEVETGQMAASNDALLAALTVDGFDADVLKAEVEGSSMSPVERLASKVLIEQAEADPEQIQSVIGELKKSLNLE